MEKAKSRRFLPGFYGANGPLKLLQQKVKRHVLDSIPVLDCVHGGVAGRSVQTNASPHINKAVVFSIDIRDFYPNVRPEMVQRLFEEMGFGAEAADLLTRITTWNEELPQGVPTSSALANLSLARADVRLRSLAEKNGFSYTRYVDDLTLSGGVRLLDFRRLILRIINEDGFSVNLEKVRTMRAGSRQMVTKLVVNEKINLSRERRMDLRRKIVVLSAPSAGQVDVSESSIRGDLSWAASVNPQLGARLQRLAKSVGLRA